MVDEDLAAQADASVEEEEGEVHEHDLDEELADAHVVAEVDPECRAYRVIFRCDDARSLIVTGVAAGGAQAGALEILDGALEDEDHGLQELQALETFNELDALVVVPLLDDEQLEQKEDSLQAEVRHEIQKEEDHKDGIPYLPPESLVERHDMVAVPRHQLVGAPAQEDFVVHCGILVLVERVHMQDALDELHDLQLQFYPYPVHEGSYGGRDAAASGVIYSVSRVVHRCGCATAHLVGM